MNQRAIHFFTEDADAVCKKKQKQLKRDDIDRKQIISFIEQERQLAIADGDLRQAYLLRKQLKSQQNELTEDLFCIFKFDTCVSLFENLRLSADYLVTEYSKRYACPVILCDYLEQGKNEVMICLAADGKLLFECSLNETERRKTSYIDRSRMNSPILYKLAKTFCIVEDMWDNIEGPNALIDFLCDELGIILNGRKSQKYVRENSEKMKDYVFSIV